MSELRPVIENIQGVLSSNNINCNLLTTNVIVFPDDPRFNITIKETEEYHILFLAKHKTFVEYSMPKGHKDHTRLIRAVKFLLEM